MERPGIDLKQLNERAMNYFEFNRKTPEPSDVIEWDPPQVDFEFRAGVCVQHKPFQLGGPDGAVYGFELGYLSGCPEIPTVLSRERVPCR
jgi:hypothetical protein